MRRRWAQPCPTGSLSPRPDRCTCRPGPRWRHQRWGYTPCWTCLASSASRSLAASSSWTRGWWKICGQTSNCCVFCYNNNWLVTDLCPVRLAQSVERCGSQSEGPGLKPRRRRLDSSVGQTANGPCLSRLSYINEYKVFLRCLPVYGGTTSAIIRWCNGASLEMFRKKHLFPQRGY